MQHPQRRTIQGRQHVSTFRLRTRTPYPPDPGDLLENVATGNRWRVHAARPIRRRHPDPPHLPHAWQLDVERVPSTTHPPADGRVWPFERDR